MFDIYLDYGTINTYGPYYVPSVHNIICNKYCSKAPVLRHCRNRPSVSVITNFRRLGRIALIILNNTRVKRSGRGSFKRVYRDSSRSYHVRNIMYKLDIIIIDNLTVLTFY